MVKHISKIAHGSDVYYIKDTEARSALIDKTEKGVANGVATLDSGGKIPSSQLPSYVDDVEEYSSLSNFPATGESGKIYVDTTTNLSYRWSGSTYVTISSDLALGETSSTAYAGDKGKAVTDNFNTHAANTDIHVTAAEKEYWNSKVNAPSYSAPTAKTLTYTGLAQDLLNAGSSTAGAIQYSTDEINWSTAIPQGTNADTYTVYWRFVGSEVTYVDSTKIEVTIVKGDASFTAPTAKSGLVYDGTAKNLLNEGSTSNGTISYSLDEIEWSTSIPQGTNATDYIVYWKLTGDSNHNDIDSTSIAVNIAKVTPTVTAPTAKVLIYNTSAQVLANNGSTNFGTLQYSSDNTTWSSNIPSGTNTGDYSVYYKVVGDSNINDVTSTAVSCAISKVTPTVTAPTAKSLTYNTQSQVLANAGSTDYGTIKYSLDGVDYSTTIPSATNVGFYTLYYKVDGDSNVNDVSAQSVSCLIDAKTVSSPTITLATNSYIYDGSAKQPSVTSVEDGEVLIPSSEYTVEYSNNTNAGTGIVTISDANGGNYTVSGSTTFTINKAVGSVTTVPVATNDTYNGSAKVLATTGSGTGTMYYSLDNVSFSTSIPTSTNAGNWTLYYYAAESYNYTQSSTGNIAIALNKANLSASVSMAGWTYDGTASNPSVSGNSGSGNVTYSYKISGADDSTYTSTKPSNAGAYVVRATIDVTTNYNGATVTNTFTIAKINPTVTAPTPKTLTYNGYAQNLINAGSTNYGTLQYSMDNSSWSTTIPSQTNAGTYTVYWRVVGDSNINDVPAQNMSCSIGKANRTVTISGNSTTLESGTTNTITVTTEGSPTITVISSNTNVAIVSGMTVTAAAEGTITITITVAGDSNHNEYTYSYTLTVTRPTHNGHEYVDLGLPSGTKWATMNVGATSETDYGNFYQYGRGVSQYDETKDTSNYSGVENPLSSSADTATQVWGGSWHMPTKIQCTELIENTTYSWETINGVIGAKFTASNGNYIFTPATGFFDNGNNTTQDSSAPIWSSSPDGKTYAYWLIASSDTKFTSKTYRRRGAPVRPVFG